MKGLIASVFLGLSGLSAIALMTRPRIVPLGLMQLVRTTDAHPNRQLEAASFHQQFPKSWMSIDTGSNNIQKIITQCSSGVGPDVFDTYGSAQLQTYVEAGVALDVTDAAKQMGFSMDDKTWPAVRGELSYQGRQYSYPGNVNVNILVYNKNIFDRFGVPYPKDNMTWDAFFALAQKVSRGQGLERVYGITPTQWGPFFDSQRGQFFSPDGTKLLLAAASMRKAFQEYHDALFKYHISPTSLDLKAMTGQGGFGSGSINQFADGHFAMIYIGKWALTSFNSAHKDQLAKLEAWQKSKNPDPKTRPEVLRLGSVPMPHYAGLPPCYGATSRSVTVNTLGLHRKEATQILQFLASKKYAEILNSANDALPGNPKYAMAGLQPGPTDLAGMEMHRNTIAAMKYGYQPSTSPFLLTNDVTRILGEQISRIESDQTIKVEDALATAQDDCETLMQRNLDRDPKLKAKYKQLTGSDRVVGQA